MAKTPATQILARYRLAVLNDAELEAAFLAARDRGQILSDDVIAAIVQAVATA